MERSSIIVGISGGSGSGKSWLAQRIQAQLPEEAVIFEQDWYYRDLSNLPIEVAEKNNFDHPDAIEIELLFEQLSTLASGQAIEAPEYRYATYERLAATRRLEPRPLILVEGIFALHWKRIRSLMDTSLFIDVDSNTRRERRLKRDRNNRGYSDAQILKSWERDTLPMHLQFVQPTARFADTIWNPSEDTAFETTFLADLQTRLAKNGNEPL